MAEMCEVNWSGKEDSNLRPLPPEDVAPADTVRLSDVTAASNGASDGTCSHHVPAAGSYRTSDPCLDAFPEPGDWQGWIDLWCRQDTGNIDCVPEVLRHHVADLVTPEGWLKYPRPMPSTPYQIARWSHCRPGAPMPPWHGTGIKPFDAKRIWEEHLAQVEQDASREAARHPDLYFIGSAAGPIKIGLSSNVRRRFEALQGSSPSKLELVCVAPGEGMRETEMHERFAEHRLHGEWFAPAPELLAEIERLSMIVPPFAGLGGAQDSAAADGVGELL